MSNAKKTFCFGITCKNREDLYYKTLQSLFRMSPQANILILDDCSEAIDHALTLSYFPKATIHYTSSPTGRADFAIHHLWELFLKYDMDYLVNIDSDMLVASNLLDQLHELVNETQGIFSLFNTNSHPAEKIGPKWVEKKSFGSAGTVIRRDLVEQIIKQVPVSVHWDWDWCAWLKTKKIALVAVRESMAQHLGLTSGQNTSAYKMGDFGQQFIDYNGSNAASSIESLVELIKSLQNRINTHEQLMSKLVQIIAGKQDL
jgi:hypothetical protein